MPNATITTEVGEADRITFKDAATAAAVDYETIRRWTIVGVRRSEGVRIKLHAFRVGGRRFTSRTALNAFLTACNGGAAPQPVTSALSMTLAERRKRARRLYGDGRRRPTSHNRS